MKKFKVSVPAHMVIEIEARDEQSARRKAKDLAGYVMHEVGADFASYPLIEICTGQFVTGCDSIEEIKS